MRPRVRPRPAALNKKFGPQSGRLRLTNSAIDAFQPKAKDYHIKDELVRELQLKITPTGRKVFLIRYRNPEGRGRKFTIGVFPTVKITLARQTAKDKLAQITQGGDPSAEKTTLRESVSFKEFAERFMTSHADKYLRLTTARNYQSQLNCHLFPAIGKIALQSITKQQIREIHQSMHLTPYQANGVLALVRAIFNMAIEWEVMPSGSNPTKGIKRFPEQQRETLLSEAQRKKVGKVIGELRLEKPALKASFDAITLIFLTGLRLNEALRLRWSDIDFERDIIFLRTTKTVPRAYPMVGAVRKFMKNLRKQRTSEVLFPSRDQNHHLTGVKKPWDWIRSRANIEGFRIHDIRHTLGSDMARYADITTIANVLGHATPRTTERYVHAQSKTVRVHLNRAADETAKIFNL